MFTLTTPPQHRLCLHLETAQDVMETEDDFHEDEDQEDDTLDEEEDGDFMEQALGVQNFEGSNKSLISQFEEMYSGSELELDYEN
jgi:hypothetical protein